MKLKKTTYALIGLIALQFLAVTIFVLVMAAHQEPWPESPYEIEACDDETDININVF